MNFIVRPAVDSDCDQLLGLAKQFSLLNLPANKRVIERKVEESYESFSGEREKHNADYIFVVEDLENGRIAGSSQVRAKHGTVNEPSYSFKVLKKERFSKGLGLGFIHQILRLRINEDGPSEIGGLVVDKYYRRRPEKVGKIVSLSRFNFIGLFPEKFEETLYSQMAPPLTEDGKSEFWEALGRRFTGMPYHEADEFSQKNKEFIRSLFPEEDIYLCLLDAEARLVLGRVSQETQAALHMLEKIGFTYNNEVDPFDGGPHLQCSLKDVSLIKKGKKLKVSSTDRAEFKKPTIIGVGEGLDYRAGGSPYKIEGEEIILPQRTKEVLQLQTNDFVYLTEL